MLGWSGIFVDDVMFILGGVMVFSDDVEIVDLVWMVDGFSWVGVMVMNVFVNYYIVFNCLFVLYDKYLKIGLYNFGFGIVKLDWVEYFVYE